MIEGCAGRAGDRCVLWLAVLFAAASISGCRSEGAKTDAASASLAVKLVLVPDRSDGCCGIVSVNDEGRAIRAFCEVTAFDPQGRLIFAGLVPGPPPGERRNPMTGEGGFLALPGRQVHDQVDLPIDLTRDTYRSKCRIAIWHGAPPL